MSDWVEGCKTKYRENKSEHEYVRCLLKKIQTQAGDQRLQERGIRALFELTKERGSDARISIEDLRHKSGTTRKQSQSCGLWGWIEAGVVKCYYQVDQHFYQAVQQVLTKNT